MPYRRKGVRTWTVAVPLPRGRWVKLSTGFNERRDALRVERMLSALGPRGRNAVDLLARVVSGDLQLRDLLAAYEGNDLESLRASLADVDVEPLVDAWLRITGERVAADTVQHYRHTVRRFIPAGARFPRSRFSVDVIESWIASYPAGRSTRRKVHAGLSQFGAFLVNRRVLTVNPLRSIQAARAAPPRLEWRSVLEMQRLADAQSEPYRTLSALLGGTGIEVSTAIGLVRRDVDTERKEIRAAGTKTHARDRIARVADWSWPYIERHIRSLHPNAPLFPGLDRWIARDAHVDACQSLGFLDYRQHDQRHSWAVRQARVGTPAELIARQLGHANAVMVLKIYGRFMPSQQDRDKWEQLATIQDQRDAITQSSGSVRGSVNVAPENTKAANPRRASGLRNSRGGTRTRDPGIMSAVL